MTFQEIVSKSKKKFKSSQSQKHDKLAPNRLKNYR